MWCNGWFPQIDIIAPILCANTSSNFYFSYVKQATDGDDEVDSKSPSMSVTYVNFDKTKPNNIHKQIGDGLPHSSTKTQNNSSKHNLKNCTPLSIANNGRINAANKESEISVVEKSKNRRQNKVDLEAKQTEVRQTKKHKKDI